MNNLLKSVLTSAYEVWPVVFSLISTKQLMENTSPAWLGVLLTHLPVVAFLMRLMLLRNPARTRPQLP